MKREYLKRVLLCILVLCFAAVSIGATKFSKVYDNATQLMVDGDYAGAAELFDSIASYEDSSSLSMYCKANLLAEQGNYDEAISAFEFFGDYKDCKYLVVYYSACKLEAEAAENPEQYLEAAEKFRTISLFRDSSARSEQCKQKLYAVAQEYLDKEEYQDAFAFFRLLEGFADSSEKMKACKYGVACTRMNEGNYSAAASMFADLGEYLDSSNLLEKTMLLSNLEIKTECTLNTWEGDTVQQYDDQYFYQEDKKDGLVMTYTFSVINNNDTPVDISITPVIDDADYSPNERHIEVGEERILIISSDKFPELFTIGEHTYVWSIDDIKVLSDNYTVLQGISDERKESIRIAEGMQTELFIAQYNGNTSPKLSNYSKDVLLSIEDLEEDKVFVPVIRVTNPFDETVEVIITAIIDGEYASWSPTELEPTRLTNCFSSDELSVGKHTVQASVNGVPAGEWTVEIVDPAAQNNGPQIGDTIAFGTYEQDTDLINGPEPIEWVVLDVQGNNALLLSKAALKYGRYNSEYQEVTWSSCTIREWLNHDFIGNAFTTEEQEAIENTLLEDTADKVFLISSEEVEKYLSSTESRFCKPTPYATATWSYVHTDKNGNCGWWLRSPGESLLYAENVNPSGTISNYFVSYSYFTVRPAMWVDTNQLPGLDTSAIGIMTYADYVAAALDDPVCIETYVQAKQSWWDNKVTLYTQNQEGGYFIYNMPCSEEDYEKLVPGQKIRVTGYKAEWSGENEIVDASFELLEGDSFIAKPVDVTDLLGKENLIEYQNQLIVLKGLTVEEYDSTGAAFAYKNEAEKTDDLYFKVSKEGTTYEFCVEYYLCDEKTDVYKTVENFKVGDVVDLEGFLYWYEGPNPHIINVYMPEKKNAYISDTDGNTLDPSEISVGSSVLFGRYEQDNDTNNGPESIEWIVLDKEDNLILLTTSYALDCKSYNIPYGNTTWETCTLRPWMNESFLNTAFTSGEKNAIIETTVDNSIAQGNSEWKTNGGNDTSDRIFLLSYSEAKEYFKSDADRLLLPTKYSEENGIYLANGGYCVWWTRSPGKNQASEAAAFYDGHLGNMLYNDDNRVAVRPAIWVDLDRFQLPVTEDTAAILDSSTEGPSGCFTPGTYRASATGMGTVTLTVTVDENSITAIEIDGSGETPGIGSVAVERLPSAIVAANTWDVDGISGATITSTAIREAVKAALEEAEFMGDSVETYPDSNPDVTIHPVPAFPSSLTVWQQQFSEKGLSTLVVDGSLPDYSNIGVSEDDIESIWAIFFPDTGDSGLVLFLSAKDSEIAEKVYSNLLNVFGFDSLDGFWELYGEHGAVTFEDNDNKYLRIFNDQEGTALILQRLGNNIGALGYYGDNDIASEVKSICRNFGMIPE